MKRNFRVVSAYDTDKVVSYSTLHAALTKLEELMQKHGDTLDHVKVSKPADYGHYNSDVYAWYDYVAVNNASYMVVEFNKESK